MISRSETAVETSPSPPTYDRARFYTIRGRRWPSVTTVLDVIAKPALHQWYAKEERRAFETAILELAAAQPVIPAEGLLDAVIDMVSGAKAADRISKRERTIGTASHAGVEWETRVRMGERPGPRPILPDAAELAVQAWQDWVKAVDFQPLAVERPVYCSACGYAGTADWIGMVSGVMTLGDIKTAKALYPESYLQNVAYRHAFEQLRMTGEFTVGWNRDPVRGLILRLPKLLDDPSFEAAWVPEDVTHEDFLAALRLWRWQRRMEGRSVGDPPAVHHRR